MLDSLEMVASGSLGLSLRIAALTSRLGFVSFFSDCEASSRSYAKYLALYLTETFDDPSLIISRVGAAVVAAVH